MSWDPRVQTIIFVPNENLEKSIMLRSDRPQVVLWGLKGDWELLSSFIYCDLKQEGFFSQNGDSIPTKTNSNRNSMIQFPEHEFQDVQAQILK